MILKYHPPFKRFYLKASYDERLIPKEAGFSWDRAFKLWYTIDPLIAERMIQYADDETAGIVRNEADHVRGIMHSSHAIDCDISIPVNSGLAYMGFQRAGIYFASQRDNTLIADDMGLGKTVQALGFINYDESIKSVLVVCPASVKINWSREAEKWLTRPISIHIVEGKAGFGNADFTIINYDILKKYKKELSISWHLVIYDESQYMKNPKAKRTKLSLSIPAKRRLFLTGTPIMNRPIELWPVVNACNPEIFSNYWAFAKRYCDGKQTRYGWDLTGASNLGELQTKLRSTIMIRRKKADVLKELPPKVRQIITLPATGCEGAISREQRDWKQKLDHIQKLKSIKDEAEIFAEEGKFIEAVKQLKEEMFTAFQDMAAMRHQTALSKVPAAAQYIIDALDSSEKIVVFAWHRDVIKNLGEVLGKAGIKVVFLTGDMKQEDRQKSVDGFQADPDVRVFIGNIQAAGVGITLTAASHVIFMEEDWVPAKISQAEDRCHRIGQVDSVLVQHLVLDGTLDARMVKILIEKQAIIDAALDNPVDGFDISVVEEMIRG